MAETPGKINSVSELSDEVHMLVSRLNYDEIPEEFCKAVRTTQKQLNELVMRVNLDRRQPEQAVHAGAITIGDDAHDVEVRQTINHGFSVTSTMWVKEGEVLSLRLTRDKTAHEYPCAVVGCRRGGRPEDNGHQYFLVLEKLFDAYPDLQ